MVSEQIIKLLDELNKLEQEYGRVLVEQDPNYDPSGEVTARIQLLKMELTQMGVQLSWDGWQYHILE